jgi:hypothetical protein
MRVRFLGLVHLGVSEYWAIVRDCRRAALPSHWDGRIVLQPCRSLRGQAAPPSRDSGTSYREKVCE